MKAKFARCEKGHVSSIKDWNEKTAKNFRIDINKMEKLEEDATPEQFEKKKDVTYACPVCNMYHRYPDMIFMESESDENKRPIKEVLGIQFKYPWH